MDTQQHRRRCRRFGLFCVEQRVLLGLHSLDLLEKQFEPIEFSTRGGGERVGRGGGVEKRVREGGGRREVGGGVMGEVSEEGGGEEEGERKKNRGKVGREAWRGEYWS